MALLNVGCDLGIKSNSKATVLDNNTGQILNRSLYFNSSHLSLEKFFSTIEKGGPHTIRIICEPTAMMWFPLAVAAIKRGHKVYRVKSEKVSDLRKYYKKHTKTDRVDADTLTKIPLIDEESLYEVELPQANLQALNRMIKQHARITTSISNRKRRIQDLCNFATPLLLNCFGEPFTLRAKLIYRKYFHPLRIKKLGVKRLKKILLKASDKPMKPYLAQQIYAAMLDAYHLYGSEEYIDFDALSEEMALETELLEREQEILKLLEIKMEAQYEKVHPSKNIETIPGVGKKLAPVFLATILNPNRFQSAEAFRGFTGMIPSRNESGNIDGKGGRMTKAGPSNLRRALYLAADMARKWDPQLAKHYHDQMVYKGNSHMKANCAVATKLASRILRVLKEDRPYEYRDINNHVLSRTEAQHVVKEKWVVPEVIRKRLRRKK